MHRMRSAHGVVRFLERVPLASSELWQEHVDQPERFAEHPDEAKVGLFGKGFRHCQVRVGATH